MSSLLLWFLSQFIPINACFFWVRALSCQHVVLVYTKCFFNKNRTGLLAWDQGFQFCGIGLFWFFHEMGCAVIPIFWCSDQDVGILAGHPILIYGTLFRCSVGCLARIWILGWDILVIFHYSEMNGYLLQLKILAGLDKKMRNKENPLFARKWACFGGKKVAITCFNYEVQGNNSFLILKSRVRRENKNCW